MACSGDYVVHSNVVFTVLRVSQVVGEALCFGSDRLEGLYEVVGGGVSRASWTRILRLVGIAVNSVRMFCIEI